MKLRQRLADHLHRCHWRRELLRQQRRCLEHTERHAAATDAKVSTLRTQVAVLEEIAHSRQAKLVAADRRLADLRSANRWLKRQVAALDAVKMPL